MVYIGPGNPLVGPYVIHYDENLWRQSSFACARPASSPKAGGRHLGRAPQAQHRDRTDG